MKSVRGMADAAMSVLILLLMGYSLTGRIFHEYAGAAMLALFLLHTALNRRWYGALLRGRWSGRRIWGTVTDLALLVPILLLGYSGITMSRYAFAFLPAWGGVAVARRIHLAASYWFFLLSGLHLGNHWGTLSAALRRRGGALLWGVRVLIAAACVWGAVCLVRLNLLSYLFLRVSFAFFDPSRPAALFFLDYLCVLLLFATIGYLVCFLPGRRHRAGAERRA